ncbi:Nucleolar protein 12 [Chionoecetes opilio]|uniref:Nucleolar protein 12 n=1 Tax=Chionoecetes opilio TaxID=41210 RepID=A0A8J4Y7W6_CHIOP|nr:Nucleolar protein 12 [Chionoecetes opilio]
MPSSAAVDQRLFSLGKDINRAKRSSLSDENFNMLMFMKGTMLQNLMKTPNKAAGQRQNKWKKPQPAGKANNNKWKKPAGKPNTNNKWKKPPSDGKPNTNKRKKTNRQNKLHIKFDLADRRQYLTGFQKRKTERREKAFKQLQDDLKAEKKQFKRDRKDVVKKMIQQSHELEEQGGIGMIDDDDKEEEDESVKNKVTVNCGSAMVEISDLDLTSKHHIGINQMDITNSHTEKDTKPATTDENSAPEDEDEEDVSPENLERLGIHSQQDLVRSLKKSSALALKRSYLMKKKQMRDATKQKKAQSRENTRRRKQKAKKMRHKRPSKLDRDAL